MSFPAFPVADVRTHDGFGLREGSDGMSLREYYAGQALANPMICTGSAPDYQITAWFGKHRTGITKPEIVARQAFDYADALLATRQQEPIA